MIKKQLILILIISLIFGNAVKSQDEVMKDTISVKKFSLSEAQNYALENNTSIKNKQIDIEISKKKVWETTAIGLPQFNVKGSWQYQFTVPSLEMATLIPVPITQTPDPYDHYHELQYSAIELGSKQSTSIDFTFTQLVFSGEYLVGLQASRVFKSLSEKSLEKSIIETKEQIAQTYYLVLVLKRNAEILDSSYINMEKIRLDMEQMYKQGFIEETDFSQISLTTLNIKNGLISINRQKNVAMNLLKLQMGLPFESEIELTDKLEDFLNESEFVAISLQEFSIDKNIDFQLLTVQEDLTRLSMQREKSKLLPSIAAFYRHQEQINAPEFNFMAPDILGVQIDFPIFSSGMRRAKIQEAKLELEKVQNSKLQAQDALNIEFEKTKNDFLAAQDKYLNQKENYRLSKSIYEKTLIKYKNGVSSSLDLSQVQNQYFSAQSGYFQSIVELLNIKAKLEKILNL
jgi:outer membrane protein TolC